MNTENTTGAEAEECGVSIPYCVSEGVEAVNNRVTQATTAERFGTPEQACGEWQRAIAEIDDMQKAFAAIRANMEARWSESKAKYEAAQPGNATNNRKEDR